MVNPRKVNILLTTITSLNTHHLQLGLYNIQAYFLKKMKESGNERFKFDIKVIYPKKRQGHRDYFPIYSKQEIGRIADDLLRKNPVIIGFSCFMWNIDNLLQVAASVKKKRPDILIVFGGPEVSYQGSELLKKYRFIDVVAINDGEEIFHELVEYFFMHAGGLEYIKGIVYREKNKIIATPPRETDLGRIPSPYMANLIDIQVKERSLVVETLRGCPFRCAYCSYHLGSYGRVRFFPIDKVRQELELLLKHNVPHVIITDDNFNINEDRAVQILETIIKHKKKTAIDIFLNIYVRKISSQLVDSLARARLYLSIGIQTINDRTLTTISRRSDMSLLEQNLAILKENQLLFDLQFIIGLPGDTFDDFKNNLEWGLRYKPYKISFFPLSVMHGTDIYSMASAFHIKYTKDPPYLATRTSTLSPAQLVLANQIFDAANLLYNLGLLRQSIIYMREKLGIDYYTIFNSWTKLMRNKKLQKKDLPPLVMVFITHLLAEHNVPLTEHVGLFGLVKKDMSFYYAKHYTKPESLLLQRAS